jgi:hypothetical protein
MTLTNGWLRRAIAAHKNLTKTQRAKSDDAQTEIIRAQFIARKENNK